LCPTGMVWTDIVNATGSTAFVSSCSTDPDAPM
jgi:hypothetical protein